MQNLRETALLVLRVALGLMFIAHGWTKVKAIAGVQEFFAGVGVPAPAASAYFAGYGELIGGVLLVIGLVTPLAALMLSAIMAGAIMFAHWDAGFWATDGGYEYPLMLFFTLLVVAAFGSGRFGLDAALFKKKA